MKREERGTSLASERGAAALHEAARDLGTKTTSWPRVASPEELAHHLESRAKTDDEAARVVARAKLRVGYREERGTCVELVAREARDAEDAKRAARKIEDALTKRLTDAGFAARVNVAIRVEARRTCVDLELPSRWMRVVTNGGEETRAHRVTPARATYDAGAGTLVIEAEDEHAMLVAASLGEGLFGDAGFFRERALVSLRALQSVRGAIAIPPDLASEIARVRIIEHDWDSGRAVAMELRGSDLARDAEALGLRLDAGRLTRATLRFEFTSAPHRCDVSLRAPNVITVSDSSRAAIVRACLEAIGVLSYAEPRADLWSLEPWTPSDAEARAFFGDAFDDLKTSKVLVRSKSRAVAHPEHPAAGRVLIAFPVPNEEGAWYGVSEHPLVPSRSVSDAELVTWRVKLAALGERIARTVGCEGDVRLLERRGVIDLGALRVGRVKARLFVLTRAPIDPVSLAERLRMRAMPGHAVLLVPPGRSAGTGLAEVELARVAGPYDGLADDVARALGVKKKDARRDAPSTARFVVDRGSRKVWFDGVAITPLGEQAYRLAEILASRDGAAIATKELGQMLSPGRMDDAVTRQAKRALMQAIEASFAREKRELPGDYEKVVEAVRRGEVRMGVEGFVG